MASHDAVTRADRRGAADISGRFCIAGLGLSEQGRRLGVAPRELRRRALDAALHDSGLARADIDGYIGTSGDPFDDIRYLGLSPGFAWTMQSGGATAIWSVINAVGAITTGQATAVACVYGTAPTSEGSRRVDGTVGGYGGFAYGYPSMYGLHGAAAAHALHARRHMHRYGTTADHLGAVAVVQREYAAKRPGTLGFGQPITLDDHRASPMVVDPFRMLDCCRDTDGGVVLLVTSADRARDLRRPAPRILGFGSGHNMRNWWTGDVYDLHDDIAPAKATAFGQAGLGVEDVDVAALYDPFTISPLMQLEAYGFCAPGEGGPFVASGATRLTGVVPTNTGGGQLSGYYATGFTALAEGLVQLRGEGGATQVPDAQVALVSGHGGNGGIQNTWAHATMLLGADR
ncbi:thiolase family protein [Yinghuangia sp. YIM S09857]|uniref:thiolase family protein n=1 Tax=Yinghuangia sp. YIM S09857 TaxID=3436929 RepID=UPI003F53BB57